MNKIWIFASSKILTQTQENQIKNKIQEFLKQWQAHGETLESSIEILECHFIKISVNEQQAKATGCSIDAMVKQIKIIEQEFGLVLLDRMNVFYNTDNQIQTDRLPEFKKKLKTGEIPKTSYIYNTAASTKQEFDLKWKQPIQESWAKNLT